MTKKVKKYRSIFFVESDTMSLNYKIIKDNNF